MPAQPLLEMLSNENKAITVKAFELVGTRDHKEDYSQFFFTAWDRRSLNIIGGGRAHMCAG